MDFLHLDQEKIQVHSNNKRMQSDASKAGAADAGRHAA